MLPSQHLHSDLFVYGRNLAGGGGGAVDPPEAKRFPEGVCIPQDMISLHGHECELRHGGCSRCIVAGILSKCVLTDFLDCSLGLSTLKSFCLLVQCPVV